MDPAIPSGGELLGDLARVSPDLLCAVDRSGTFVAVNPAWERTLGWSPGELVGTLFDSYLDETDRRRTWEAWETRVLVGEVVGDFENRWPRKGGGHRWISWSASLDADTGLVFCSGRDVTDRVERHLRLAHDAQLLNEAERVAGIGIWEWEIHPDRAYMSEGLCRIFGTPVGEPLSFKRLLEMIVPEDRPAYEREVLMAVDQAATFSIEYRLRRPDGREVVVWERGEPVVEAGRAVGMFGTVQDVTQQRTIEADLRRAAEREQEAAERLRQLDRLKNTFLSAVSHELRTPLTIVRGLSTTLQRLRGRIPGDQRNEIEDALAKQSVRLEGLLDRLLDVDRLAQGTFHVAPQPVDAAALVRRATFSSPARDRVSLDAPQALVVRVDPILLERIVSNLLENAEKYAGGATVTVAVEALEVGGMRLAVSDEGPGIDAGDVEHIFEPFYRADETSPRPGTGIGLSLVSQFATLHGGRVWAESNAPRGLTVVVELPDLDDVQPPPTAPSGP